MHPTCLQIKLTFLALNKTIQELNQINQTMIHFITELTIDEDNHSAL